ncbi:SdrD B-like domain-containing protein, partial [uncultured Massilia sp.]|uniref:SdrD B-like domain-containing protein n=1 Tax=uncultured Massilia sp. TaxID=169973 RepID=UPI00258AF0CD
VYKLASLGDRVWLDANANGQQDAGEAGIGGVTVTLIGGGADGLLSTTGDNTSVETTTDANGNYKFTGLVPGMEYQVKFGAPAGFVATGADVGNDASDSDAVGGLSQVVKLASGENNTTIDAGFYKTASLGDRVWIDANANGQQDAGETGVAGAKVTLIGGGADGLISTTADNTTVETTTDANGNYKFDGLTPGMEYQVQFSAPAGHVFTGADQGNDASDSDANGSGLSQIVKLASGENNTTIDAGVYAPASLGDRVWLDANGNGQQDDGETGVAGVKVVLTSGGLDGLISTTADNTSVETTTDADGKYRFDGLAPGVQYQVQFAKPAGSVFTAQDKGNDASDSDANANGLSQVVTLKSGEHNATIDAGIYLPASLGDRVWVDANANGQQDAGEVGVAGAKVTLIGGGLDGLLSTTGDNTSVDTTTDANGNYKFEGLTPGTDYQVKFTAPAGSVFTTQDKGNDASDSDANASGLTQVVKLASGENNSTIDAGVYAPASLGDRVWIDANGNGQQDAGELGAAGVKVTLIGGGLDGLISTGGDNTRVETTTDANGNYKFSGLVPGMEYQVQFGKPAGTVFTSQDLGNDASDSDANATTGLSQIVKLASGENNTTIDAGIYTPASLGNRVWLDANANGQQDANETGVAGVTVTLTGGGADGLISTTADNTTVTTTTDAGGNYLFKDLVPGMQYQVTFGKPANMFFTKKDVGLDASDSDADAVTGKTQVITLKSGEFNDTIDAGVYANASIGDRLWIDTNGNGLQDDGATGLAGRTVTLIGGGLDGLLSTTADNTSVSMLTGTDGAYNFSNLTPGVQYQVQFSKPTGYVYTGSSMGGNDVTDSDANSTTGMTRVVTLQSGENNKNLDAGLVNVTGDLSITKTDGVSFVTPGQTITYKIVVTNTGTAIAANAVVTDSIPSTLTNVTWTSSATSGASGNQASGSSSINDTVTLNGGSSITYTVTAKVASLSALETISDFSTLGNNVGVGSSKTVNGVTAEAAWVSGSSINSATLWARNAGEDKGLGVLSRGESSSDGEAATGLSNQKNMEVIRLTKDDADQWSSLWVSNLDKDGSGGAEIGTLYWSDSATPDITRLTTKFTFKAGDFGVGAESGDILSLRPSNFDASAKYVFFVAGSNPSGNNNDFLVWKAGTVPAQLSNTAKVTPPSTFIDTNSGNNSATDTDDIKLPTPVAVKRGSIGDTVWEDNNYNGIRDSGEAGIKGVTVKLLDASGKVLETTVTDSNGKYLFDNLNAGSYRVEVVEPSGYYVTKPNVGSNDGIDSDIDTANGRTGLITLTQGENDLTWDAGLYRKASLGDKVWEDLDHDDIQDSNEGGIGGVTVQLYTSGGTLLATTKTNSSGNYKFSNLDPGTYYLKFDKGDVIYKGINMDNWKWASKNVGNNDAIDSDVNGDGVSKVNVTRTDNITLSSGENDMTWDAAITPIAIDLNGDGVHTVARSASSATFDLLGTGKGIASGWLSSSDGFLAVDHNGNGKIDDISELFGGAKQGAGFSQLASYDSNHDGVVDARDAAFGDLRIWQDANGNHQTDDGELMTLAQAGVVSLKVDHVVLPFVDGQGNLHLERSSATLANGHVTDMTDVYFAIDARDAAASGAPTLADLLASVETDAAVPVAIIGQAAMAA